MVAHLNYTDTYVIKSNLL